MRRSHPSAVALLALALTVPGHAQVQQQQQQQQQQTGTRQRQAKDSVQVVYDWSTQLLRRAGRLRSGGRALFRLTGTNPLCYTYDVDVQEIAGQDDALDVRKLLAGGYTPPPAPETENRAAGEQASDARAERLTTAEVAALPASEDDKRFLGEIAAKILALDEIVSSFDDRICANGGTARMPRANVLSLWAREAAPAYREVQDAIGRVEAIRGAVTDANLRATLDTLLTRLKAIRAEGDNIRLRLETDTDVIYGRDLEDDTEQVVITFHARPYAQYEELDVISNTENVSVRRYHRRFLSLGFVHTDADATDYERRNVISADSTISTYINVGRGSNWVISPVVAVNFTLFDIQIYEAFHPSMTLSGGVTTNGRDPQFLLGVGLGFSDRVALTAYAHFFPSEELLLGDPDAVRQKSVPTEIGDADAVRSRLETGFAFGLSYRL